MMIKHLQSELENWQVLIPIGVAAGILVFFNLNFNPHAIWCIAILILSLALFKTRSPFILSIAMISISVGFNAAALRTWILDTQFIDENIYDIKITANVDEVSRSESSQRVVLTNIHSPDIFAYPNKMRISSKSNTSFKIGDKITTRASIMPPPHPTLHDGFNYRFYAYFKGINAIGYTTRNIKVIEESQNNSSFHNWIENLRLHIKSQFLAMCAAPYGAIAAGMLMGDASAIDPITAEAVRISGIAHIIAISGMHIVVIIAIIFFLSNALLSLSTYIISNYSTKKISAFIAIIITSFYLLIAGSPISAQRAFVMSSITLIAIILDRNASPMRSIAIAALVLMILTPESIMSASLQMSLAACICLVATFDVSKKICERIGFDSQIKRILTYCTSIVVATLAAGLATAPYVIYHFNQFSTYSILTNLFAIPLSDFLIMPLGLAAMVAMPFGLEAPFMFLLEKSIMLMIEYAKYISSLPYASLYIPSLSHTGIIIFSLSALLLCTLKTPIRYLMWALILLSFSTINATAPDIIIDSSGKLISLKLADNKFAFSNERSAKFSKKTWVENFGIKHAEIMDELNNPLFKLQNDNLKIAINNSDTCPSEEFDLLISLKKSCQNNEINMDDLNRFGTHSVYLNHDKISVRTAINPLSHRPWD